MSYFSSIFFSLIQNEKMTFIEQVNIKLVLLFLLKTKSKREREKEKNKRKSNKKEKWVIQIFFSLILDPSAKTIAFLFA